MNEAIIPAEKLIANELAKLSLKEREEVYEDLHGIRNPIEETPELIQDSIHRLEIEIDKIQDKLAYVHAMMLSTEFVTKLETRIKFLRAESFDAKKAAERIVRYFQCRLELFGLDNLVRDIGLDDLDEMTVAAIASGVVQVLQNRDSRGRGVITILASFFRETDYMGENGLLSCSRLIFYALMSVVDDEETQKKGIVAISYAIDHVIQSVQARRKILQTVGALSQCLPIRIGGFHYCHNAPLISPLLSIIAFAAESAIKVRIRTHHGSHTECQYMLMTFGISIESFPVSTDGRLSLSNHEKWMEKRRLKEAYLRKTSSPLKAIDIPSRSDVLLGRGRPFNMHPGNRLLHEIVESYYKKYDDVPREEKTKIAEEIIGIVRQYGGQFLKQNVEAGVWVEVSGIEARNKVNHSFRRKREYDLKAAAAASSLSSTKEIEIESISVEDNLSRKRRKALG